MRFLTAALVAFLAVAAPAAAAPMDAALQTELLALQAAFTKAVAAGDFKKALTLLSAEQRKGLEKEIKTQKARKELSEMMKGTTPDSFDVEHTELSEDGTQARIEGLAKLILSPEALKRFPDPPPDGVAQSEMTYEFAKEKGTWKYVTRTFGPDPRTIAACDAAFGSLDDFDRDKDVGMGGMIRRVAFETDHILIVIRIVDEEQCLFLPPREEIEKKGFNAALLQPRAIIEANGSPHRSDKQKVWVEGLKVQK